MAIRILIIDDHRLFRAGIKTLLTSDIDFEIVGEASNGNEGLRVAQDVTPDVVLMDMGMPGMDGLETTRQFVSLIPNTKVLIMTMYEDSELVRECILAGASGYIIKRAAESELTDAINAIWRGMIYIHPSLISAVISAPPQARLQNAEKTESLSNREIEVLRLVVKGYTNHQIGAKLNISVRTVETHRSNLMGKLGLHSRVDLVRYANEHGLL